LAGPSTSPTLLSAGFVVVISGNMMLMPGLPKVSRASSIDVDDSGAILGV
jgi:formate--tetrahydrofolate ligase